MDFSGTGAPLSADGVKAASDRLSVQPAALWAVLRVETRGCGYMPDRRPQILFERHIFHKETGGAFDATARDVSDPAAGGDRGRGGPPYEPAHPPAPLHTPPAGPRGPP